MIQKILQAFASWALHQGMNPSEQGSFLTWAAWQSCAADVEHLEFLDNYGTNGSGEFYQDHIRSS